MSEHCVTWKIGTEIVGKRSIETKVSRPWDAARWDTLPAQPITTAVTEGSLRTFTSRKIQPMIYERQRETDRCPETSRQMGTSTTAWFKSPQ